MVVQCLAFCQDYSIKRIWYSVLYLPRLVLIIIIIIIINNNNVFDVFALVSLTATRGESDISDPGHFGSSTLRIHKIRTELVRILITYNNL